MYLFLYGSMFIVMAGLLLEIRWLKISGFLLLACAVAINAGSSFSLMYGIAGGLIVLFVPLITPAIAFPIMSVSRFITERRYGPTGVTLRYKPFAGYKAIFE